MSFKLNFVVPLQIKLDHVTKIIQIQPLTCCLCDIYNCVINSQIIVTQVIDLLLQPVTFIYCTTRCPQGGDSELCWSHLSPHTLGVQRNHTQNDDKNKDRLKNKWINVVTMLIVLILCTAGYPSLIILTKCPPFPDSKRTTIKDAHYTQQ